MKKAAYTDITRANIKIAELKADIKRQEAEIEQLMIKVAELKTKIVNKPKAKRPDEIVEHNGKKYKVVTHRELKTNFDGRGYENYYVTKKNLVPID